MANITDPEALEALIGSAEEVWPECVNKGCHEPRSNATDECFRCRHEPFGTEWQLEQMERMAYR